MYLGTQSENGNLVKNGNNRTVNYRKETPENIVAPVDTSSNNQNKEGIKAHNIRRLDIEEIPDKDIIWNAEEYTLHTENESESEEESYWDSSSHIEEDNMIDMGHDLDPKEKIHWETADAVTYYEPESEEESYWNSSSKTEKGDVIIMNNELDSQEEIYQETVETFTNCELEPKENKYSQVKEGDEIGMILDSKDGNYWKTAEAVTNYEPKPKKDFQWDNKLQNEKTKGIKPDSDPEEEIYWDGLPRTKGEDMRTKTTKHMIHL